MVIGQMREDPAARGRCDQLGPLPVCTVAALADLGLDDAEIANYHGVEARLVARLRRAAETGAATPAGGIDLSNGLAACVRALARESRRLTRPDRR